MKRKKVTETLEIVEDDVEIEDGSVSDVEVVRGVDPALDREAIRVVKASPKWTPGKQRGEPVRVAFFFPIDFKLM